MTDPKYDPIDASLGADQSLADVAREAWRMFRPHPGRTALVVGLSLAVAVADLFAVGLVVPFIYTLSGAAMPAVPGVPLLQELTGWFNGLAVEDKIRAIAVAIAVVTANKMVLTHLQMLNAARLSMLIEREIRLAFLDLLLRLEIGFLNRNKIGQVFALLNNFTVHSARVAGGLIAVVPLVLLLAIYFAVLTAMSLPLTGLALVIVAVSLGLIGLLARRLGALSETCARVFVRLNQLGFELIGAMKVVRLFAQEPRMRERYAATVRLGQDLNLRVINIKSLMDLASSSIGMLTLAALLFFGTYLVAAPGSDWVYFIVTYIAIMGRLAGPVAALNAKRAELAADLPPFKALSAFRRAAAGHLRREGSLEFRGLTDDIRFERVSFAFDAGGPEAVGEMSFVIPRGRTTAIVGASGSGKSTLVTLLAGLNRPTAGHIVVNGRDLAAYKSDAWRRRIGVVSQDTFLFNTSILENIRFGRPDATAEECAAAARSANADEFIAGFAAGYETTVGDRGARLSGGQAQRVAIARAVLIDPDLLILDEATSALDTQSERLVQEAIDRLSRDRTVVVVAHRLSTVRHADQIIVVENGRIVEQGRHEDLITREGRYWRYVQLQDLRV